MPWPSGRAQALARVFRSHYGNEPHVFQAPGRINLIGEHTDYNQGWVMPGAIHLRAWVAVNPRADSVVHLRSAQFPDAAMADLRQRPPAGRHWSASLLGVAWLVAGHAAAQGQRTRGANLLLDSEVPIGGGLSSSAAAEVALGLALAHVHQIEIGSTELARLCQRASHEFAGTRCGLMDPYISCHGRAGALCELDTRDLQARWHPWPATATMLVGDTGVHHANASSGYNSRRSECERAAALLGILSLREVALNDLDAARASLPPPLDRRCRHVVTENARVAAAASALDAGNFAALGARLNESHASLRDDFEVSCAELNRLTDLLQGTEGVYGARMMGGGFGGCVLAVARPEAAAGLPHSVGAAYARFCGKQPAFWICHPEAGAGAV